MAIEKDTSRWPSLPIRRAATVFRRFNTRRSNPLPAPQQMHERLNHATKPPPSFQNP